MKNNLEPSAGFKAQAAKAIISIVFFMLTYTLLLSFAVGLTIACVSGGLAIIAISPGFITLFLGIGLASLGLLILIFLIKFIFKSHKTDRSNLHEIQRAEEPALFKMIDEIVAEVETSFPKKVYLSTDVNASVFYDFSFWSMFLPVKKNLHIGLGLVNTVSQTELKAILSHEFGHFSQRTMKVGSYVYHVNQVIFNMLYDNENYDKIIQKWGSINGLISIFVFLAVNIIRGIQWILRKQYDFVNKSYLGLSREMEFHADKIAASVTGFEPLKNALLRLSLAEHAYNAVLSFYEAKIDNSLKSENIFKEQSFVVHFLAEYNKIKIKNGLPHITLEEIKRLNKSRLVIKDQWASHPSTEDRVARLEATGFAQVKTENGPANDIFTDIGQRQRALTDQLFSRVTYPFQPAPFQLEDFQTEYRNSFLKDAFSNIYNGYYDNKNPALFDLSDAARLETSASFEELFSDQKVDMVNTAIALQGDMASLKMIANKAIPVKSFDYEGARYQSKDAAKLLATLELQLERLNEQIKQNDMLIFSFFKQRESAQGLEPRLETAYHEFFSFDKEFDEKYEIHNQLSNALQFINVSTPYDQIRINFLEISRIEAKLKTELKKFLENSDQIPDLTSEIRDDIEKYLAREWTYFRQDKYVDGNLEILFNAMSRFAYLLSRRYFLQKKDILDYQEQLLRS